MTELPLGVTEAQLIDAMARITRLLANSFVFGYFTKEDIEQECWVTVLEEALPKYDASRPLGPFLFTHCRNRLSNFRRKHYMRNDPPCKLCHSGRHEDHPDGQICEPYRLWRKRNDSKASAARPAELSTDSNHLAVESVAEAAAMESELLEIIDAGLPAKLRGAWLRVRAGQRISRGARDELGEALAPLLESYLS